MTAHAVIFSSAADRESAHLCAAHLRGCGWLATVAMDAMDGPPAAGEILTTFRRRGNLNGSECVAGIMQTMIDQPGDILAKIDADTMVAAAGMAWLAGAADRARGFAIGGRFSGCAWAARRDVMAAALRLAAGMRCLGCAESRLSAAAFQRAGGFDLAATSQVWRAGRAIRSDAGMVTFPSFISPAVRAEELREMFAAANPQ